MGGQCYLLTALFFLLPCSFFSPYFPCFFLCSHCCSSTSLIISPTAAVVVSPVLQSTGVI